MTTFPMPRTTRSSLLLVTKIPVVLMKKVELKACNNNDSNLKSIDLHYERRYPYTVVDNRITA